MNGKDFFDRVVELRRLQKEYFATRSRDILMQAKAVEKEIDDEIDRVNQMLATRSRNNIRH